MALPIVLFGAHVCGSACCCNRNKLSRRPFEFRRQHVIRIIAESSALQGNVWGVIQRFASVPTQRGHPSVIGTFLGESSGQRVFAEMRKSTRCRKRPDVHQRFDPVSMQDEQKIVERACRVTDGVKSNSVSGVFRGWQKRRSRTCPVREKRCANPIASGRLRFAQ